MRKLIIIVALLGSLVCFGQKQGPESVVFPFSLSSVDPSVMGGNYLLSGSEAWAALNGNVAIVPMNEEENDIESISFTSYGKGSNSISGGFSYIFNNKFAVSLAYQHHRSAEYEIINASKVVEGKFTPKDMIFGLGLSYRPLSFLSVGVNARYLISLFGPNDEDGLGGFCFDASAVYSNNEGLSLVAGVNSLGAKINGYSLPTSVVAGVEYGLGFGEVSALKVGVEGNYFLYGGIRAGVNAEYGWNDMVFVRGGYSYSHDAPVPSFASVGLGVKYYGVELCGSYRMVSNSVYNSFLIGLVVSF